MSDIPAPAPDQQDNPGQQAPAVQSQGENWKARYDGLVRKVEELTLASRTANDQLVAKSSEIEQLKQQLGIKETEKQVAVGEHSKRLQDALTAQAASQTELDALRALKLQVEVAQELGKPELLKLASRLPAMTDKEALKTIMLDFANFADDAVKAREKQLMSGVTPPLGTGGGAAVTGQPPPKRGRNTSTAYSSGSAARKKAMNDYGDWLDRQNNPH